MYCKNCGNEVAVGNYCTNCGSFVGANTEIMEVEAPLTDAQRLKNAFTSKLFFAMSVMSSIEMGVAALILLILPIYFAVIPMDYGMLVGCISTVVVALFMVLPIIELVGKWKTYVRNLKGETADSSGPKILSVVARINYIVQWVFCAAFALLGIGIICMFIINGEPVTSERYDGVEYNGIMMLVFSIAFIIVAIGYAVILLLYTRRVVRFYKELAESAESGIINITNPKSLATWVLVMGIISAAGSASSGGTSLIPAAIEICLSIWIKKNFVTNE